MKQYQSKEVTFYIEDDRSGISLSMHGEKHIGCRIDDNDHAIEIFDKNQIECSYGEHEENGWCFGCCEYLSTTDLKAMANGIRSVIYNQVGKFAYNCQNDFFCIELQHDHITESYSFTVVLATSYGASHTSITKSNLTYAQLDEYVQPFFEWEKQYPIVM